MLAMGLAMAAESVPADVLFWQVSAEDAVQSTVRGTTYAYAADYAVLKADLDDGTIRELGSSDLAPFDSSSWMPVTGTEIAGGPYRTIWIELYQTDDGMPSSENQVAWSVPVAYSTLADFMSSETQLAPGALVWRGGTFAPEPTSGLLMWLGLSGLALRRKRRAV